MVAITMAYGRNDAQSRIDDVHKGIQPFLKEYFIIYLEIPYVCGQPFGNVLFDQQRKIRSTNITLKSSVRVQQACTSLLFEYNHVKRSRL